MSDIVLLALITGFGTLAGPALMAWLLDKLQRRKQVDSDARQDKLAAAAAEAARQQLEVNKQNGTTLKVIHTLVNSNLTAAIQGRLDALRAGLVQLMEIIALKKDAGAEPSKETEAQVIASRTAIAALEADLAEREKQNQQISQAQTDQMMKDLRGPQPASVASQHEERIVEAVEKNTQVVEAVKDNTQKTVETGNRTIKAIKGLDDAVDQANALAKGANGNDRTG